MLRSRVFVLSALAAVASGGAAAVEPDYLPLETGNVWVYRAGAQSFTVEVARLEVADRRSWAVLRGFPGHGELWLRMEEDGTLKIWDAARQQETVWAAFGMPEGSTYATGIDPCNLHAVLASKNDRYTGPVGEFNNALRITYPPAGCADAGLTEEVFVPYVGLVRRTTTSIAGPVNWELIYARLGCVTVIGERSASFALALNQAVYTANLMPPVDPLRSVPELTARLALSNRLEQPLRLEFPSGQAYDLEIKNEQGEVVYRWSDGRAFTQALRSETVPAGIERDYVVVARLAGTDGQPLPQGRYSAEGWLTTSGPRVWLASVPFEIRHVY